MGNFELFYQEKLDLNQVNQIYYTPESAFIELNPGWFDVIIMLALNIQLNH
jgi:hypothetical protein